LIICINPEVVSEDDIKKLEELGFVVGDENFKSYRYGSA
jgi:hypothetical protein